MWVRLWQPSPELVRAWVTSRGEWALRWLRRQLATRLRAVVSDSHSRQPMSASEGALLVRRMWAHRWVVVLAQQ